MKDYARTKKYPIDSIVIWENYLVYGTALGISAKALAALPIQFPAAEQAAAAAYWGGVHGVSSSVGDFGASLAGLSDAITSISSASSASYGASGAGSSGSSSGGGGGGGGGGAG